MGNIFQETLEKHQAAARALGKHLGSCTVCSIRDNYFCDDWQRLLTEALAAPQYPAAPDVIKACACPLNNSILIACFVCNWGHLTECHAPQTCAEAQCSHYCAQLADEGLVSKAEERPGAAIAGAILDTTGRRA